MAAPLPLPTLPVHVQSVLDDFVKSSRDSFENNLSSIVMFGSGAEGKLRVTSDLNLILVLARFEQTQANRLRQPLRFAQAAVRLQPMLLLRDEIPSAARLFASKFADILRRRVILFGTDPFASVSIPREAEILYLKQQLLNLTLRLRSAYVARSLREEQLARFLAASIGPVRASAAALLELEGSPSTSPQSAFENLGAQLRLPQWEEILSLISSIQEAKPAPGAPSRVLSSLLEFCRASLNRAETLSSESARESF